MTVLLPVIVAVVVIGVDVWVFTDARRWARRGTPVVFRLGAFALATPEAWAVACLVVFVIFVPIYASARRS